MAPKLTQVIVDQWLEAAWRDGYAKGVDGLDDLPNFADLCPKKESQSDSPEFLSTLPFDPTKCEARILKEGYGVQCTRGPLSEGCLCKVHQKKFDSLGEGLDIPFGRYNQERPLLSLDKQQKVNWADLKQEKKGNQSSKKSKVAEPSWLRGWDIGLSKPHLRDFLSQSIPNENYKGKSKSDLLELYNEEMERPLVNGATLIQAIWWGYHTRKSLQSEETTESPIDVMESDLVDAQSQQVAEFVADAAEQDELVISQVDEQSVETTPIETPEPVLSDQSEEEIGEMLDDGAGTGLKPNTGEHPKGVSGYKKLFKELGINAEGLNGIRSYKSKYDEYLEGEETEDLSDEDLDEDNSKFDTIDYEGVDYLEDNDSGEIYNTKHVIVGSWNEDCDDIIWISDEFRQQHEQNRS